MKYNKFRAIKTVVDGIRFDSRKEANFYSDLLIQKKAHNISERVVDIQLQPAYELQEGYHKNGKKVRNIKYVADFLVTYADGREEIIDVKSEATKTPLYKLKKKIFEYKYPDLSIKEVF